MLSKISRVLSINNITNSYIANTTNNKENISVGLMLLKDYDADVNFTKDITHIIIYDVPYKANDIDQMEMNAILRWYSISNENKIKVYKFVIKDTLEELIYNKHLK
jgi:SNF2 family DNA or RNA helicase